MKSEPLLQRAIIILKENFPDEHPALCTAMTNLAQLYQSQSEYEKAYPLYQDAINSLKKIGSNRLSKTIIGYACMKHQQKEEKSSSPSTTLIIDLSDFSLDSEE